jgi:hypothetical protein
MEIGALIVAAGMSSRMGEFKPMLPIGSISVAQRVVATLNQAGIGKIVMVTGYNATMLERHLAGNGIIFLRNENFATTQMFDSVKIGLAYLQDKCDKVLVVAHGGVLHAVVTLVLGLDVSRFWEGRQQNCCVHEIGMENGSFTLLERNANYKWDGDAAGALKGG